MNKNRLIWGLLLVIALSFASFYFFNPKKAAFYLYNEKNEKVEMNHKDGPLMIFVWSATCPGCIHSLPHVKILSELLAKKGGKIELVLIADNHYLIQLANAHFVRQGIKGIKTLYDRDLSFKKAHDIKVFPTMLIYDKNGKLLEKTEGAVPWATRDKVLELNKILGIDLLS